MFSGIVSGAYPVELVDKQNGMISIGVKLPPELLAGLEIGASVAIDGTCLTVTAIDGPLIRFDVVLVTLETTTLHALEPGSMVNVERSLNQGAELGGHLISGHVDGVAEIVSIERPPNNFILKVRVPKKWMPYVFPKGYLALNGTSLTAAEVDKATGVVCVYLIPETLLRTSFSEKKVGDGINFEVDRNTQVLVDTVRGFLQDLVDRRELGPEQIQALQEGPLVRDLTEATE